MTYEENKERYLRACHAVQSGVAAEMQIEERRAATEPKHLRTGINCAMVEHSALVELLVSKGVITREEFAAALADGMEEEVRRYEERLSRHHGATIVLA